MMRKFILISRFDARLLPSLFQNYRSNNLLHSLITCSFTFSQNRACSLIPEPREKTSVLVDYLIGSLKFSKAKALFVSNSFPHIKSIEKPEKVVLYLKTLGFSDAHIRSLAFGLPRILCADVEKTLKPKVTFFFQELGLSGPRLATLLSENPLVLKYSVNRSLRPCICVIKKIYKGDGNNKSDEEFIDDLFRLIKKSNRIFHSEPRLEENVKYLESCGIVGSQMSNLLLKRPWMFSIQKKTLEELVSRALDMNFTIGSRMLVHAVFSLSCMSTKTLDGKFELFRTYGFSKDELAQMFRRSPFVFRLSIAKLRWKINFFLNNIKIDKLHLVKYPVILTCSLEERIIPRWKVFEILKSRNLLRKDLSFHKALYNISDEQFLERYILPYKNDDGELLSAFSDHAHVPSVINNAPR